MLAKKWIQGLSVRDVLLDDFAFNPFGTAHGILYSLALFT